MILLLMAFEKSTWPTGEGSTWTLDRAQVSPHGRRAPTRALIRIEAKRDGAGRRERIVRLLTSDEYAPSTDGGPAVRGPFGALYVSIVCSSDGARFASVAASEQDCLAQVARYVAEQAAPQLWPQSAQRVHELLAAGDTAAAVAEYFRYTGERWEREWLVCASLDADPHSTAWSGAIPLPELARLAGSGLPG